MKVVQSSATTGTVTTFVTGLKAKTAYTFEVTAINSIGEGAHSMPTVAAVTMQAVRKYIFVSDFANDRVLRFDHATKAFKDVFVQKGSGGLKEPHGLAFNKYDDATQPRTFYVSSGATSSILQFDACDGSFVKKWAHVPGEPRGIKFHTLPSKHTPARSQKVLLVASHHDNSVRKYNAMTGSQLGTYATGVKNPQDVVVGPPTNTNNPSHGEDIFVTSTGEDAAIQFVNKTGTFRAKFTDKKVNGATSAVFAPGPAPPPVPTYFTAVLGAVPSSTNFPGGAYSFHKETVRKPPFVPSLL